MPFCLWSTIVVESTKNNEQVVCLVCLVNLVNTRVLLRQSSDLHGRYRRYPQNQPFLSFHLTRFSNPTVPLFHIPNCASCLCLRHAIIIPICNFFPFFPFFSHAKSFCIFSCHREVSIVLINVAQASFLCPAPSGPTRCGHYVLYNRPCNLVVGPWLQAVTPTLVVSLTNARVETQRPG